MVGEKMEDPDSAARRLGIKKKDIKEDYDFEADIIGKGASGVVRKCWRKGRERVTLACKTIPKSRSDVVYGEIEIMQHLHGHPGIVRLEDVYKDSESFHLVMEFVSGGNLLPEVNRVRREWHHLEEECARRIKEMMLIIKYCHGKGVVHRDIKLENVLLSETGDMKLADFGLATKFIKGQSLTNQVGSLHFVAPEVLEGNYSEKVDEWSAGIVLHGALVGFFPFTGKSDVDVLEAVINAKLSLTGKTWETISESARDLVGGMLQKDPSMRLSADAVLRHPWILHHTEKTPEGRKHTVHFPSHSASKSSKVRALLGGRFSCFSNFRHENTRIKTLGMGMKIRI